MSIDLALLGASKKGRDADPTQRLILGTVSAATGSTCSVLLDGSTTAVKGTLTGILASQLAIVTSGAIGSRVIGVRVGKTFYVMDVLSGALVPTIASVTWSGWIGLALDTGNSWANFGGGYEEGTYSKLGTTVSVRGSIKRTSGSDTTPFTLPSGYRPTRDTVRYGNFNGTIGQIVLATSGVLTITNALVNNQMLSFEFQFDTDQT